MGIFQRLEQSCVLDVKARKGDSMKALQKWLLNPPIDAPRATIFLRLMTGGVFSGKEFSSSFTPTKGSGASRSSDFLCRD
jgi:hypothetical protein